LERFRNGLDVLGNSTLHIQTVIRFFLKFLFTIVMEYALPETTIGAKSGNVYGMERKYVLKTLFTLQLTNKKKLTKFIIFKFSFSYNNNQLLSNR